jgi:hypothetical protein
MIAAKLRKIYKGDKSVSNRHNEEDIMVEITQIYEHKGTSRLGVADHRRTLTPAARSGRPVLIVESSVPIRPTNTVIQYVLREHLGDVM